jgi:formiminotetrahydrofolate cyclodeaminase
MMLLDLTVREFLEELGSDSAVPGGGSASALAGAAAGSLVQMVARISTRKEENPHLKGAQEKAAALTDRLSDLIQRDADAFAKVMQAFRLPKGTPEDKAARSRAIEAAYHEAAAVPLEVMEIGVEMLALAEVVAEHGIASAISDACVASQLSWAAVQGAAYNVRINLPGIKDEEFVQQAQSRMEELLYAADESKLVVEKCLCQRTEAR